MGSNAEMLDYWLGRCYAADVLHKGKLTDIINLFKSHLTPGNALDVEAKNRLPVYEQTQIRCFISKKYLYYLQQVLN